jgi:uncharacterized membrane protein
MQTMPFNLHPVVSSAPGALLAAVLVAEILFLWKGDARLQLVISVNLAFSAVAYLLAFFSGYQGMDLAEQSFKVSADLIDEHHTIGRIGLFLVWPTLVFQLLSVKAVENAAVIRVIYRAFLLALIGVTVYASHLGGVLVFEHGAGVGAPLSSGKVAP